MSEPSPLQSGATVPRVLVIGLDGATYDVLMPLAEAGIMPCLARLMRTSRLAQLRSTVPAITPAAWTSFLTGCQPHEHGILDYRYLDHASGQLRLNDTTRLRRPTLLDAVSADGGTVVSLRLPMTWPPRPGWRGLVVGGIDAPSSQAALSAAPALADRLDREGVRLDVSTIWRRRPRTFDELRTGVRRTREDLVATRRAAQLADELTDWRLMIVQFQVLDSLQHRCWDWIGLQDSASGLPQWNQEVHKALTALDTAVGALLELADRRQAGVVVMSDHGFGPFHGRVGLPALMQRSGALRQAGRLNAPQRRVARSAWKLRRWTDRVLRGQRATVQPQPTRVLAPIDWRHSLAVPLHGALGAMIYLNRPQRFSRGPLSTERSCDDALAGIVESLGDARHPVTNELLFSEVIETASRYGMDPIAQQWPDVIAVPANGLHTRVKCGADEQVIQDDPEMAGTHRPEGVLMVSAPSVRPQSGQQAELRDVAPTILRMLGMRPLETMSGRPLGGLCDKVQPGSAAESLPAIPIPMAAANLATKASQTDSALVTDRLRELGYID